MPLKDTQGFFNVSSRPRTIGKYDCMVLEVEDWIDGIHQPEWNRQSRQIFAPGDAPYTLNAIYNFSINKTLAATFNQTAGALPTASDSNATATYGSSTYASVYGVGEPAGENSPPVYSASTSGAAAGSASASASGAATGSASGSASASSGGPSSYA